MDTFCVLSPQWDPKDGKFEGNKDSMEMLRSYTHKYSVRPADLTSDK